MSIDLPPTAMSYCVAADGKRENKAGLAQPAKMFSTATAEYHTPSFSLASCPKNSVSTNLLTMPNEVVG